VLSTFNYPYDEQHLTTDGPAQKDFRLKTDASDAHAVAKAKVE